ncbi:MAG: antitermination protein NusG [Planctomycetes bacterium]|nr:antitermination protein NusG [Planctomycetota bacterium]
MPILAREPDLYPEDLLDRPELGVEKDVTWWAMYCLARQEKQLMRRLRALEVPFYSPLVRKRLRSPSGRVRTSHVPLFASYVFVYGDEVQRYTARSTGCVSRWVAPSDPEALTDDLRQIRRLIESGAPLTLEARLQPGTRVRVRSGPFRDLEGVILRRAKKTKLLVAVNFIQQGASVLLDDCQLEWID